MAATTIHSYIVVAQERWKVYELLKRMEEFPRYIAGVESISARRLSDTERISEWTINYGGIPVRWSQKDTLHEDTWTLQFAQVSGDFALYEGQWRVTSAEGGTVLELTLSLDWSEIQLRQETRAVLDHKARLAVRWMFRQLRQNIGPDQIISIWPLLDLKAPILSERIEYTNRVGKRMVGYSDHLDQPTHTDTIVVIPPGYGETKRDSLPVAYYLAKNGFRVVRYDATDHVGESEGEMTQITMTKQKADLLSTLDALHQRFGVEKFAVVASSLAHRVAVKAAAEDPRIRLLVGMVAVVDLRETLKVVYQEDMIGEVAAGRGKETYEVLGFEVSQEYHRSAIRDRFHDLETTIEDLRHVTIPVVFFVGERDAWVRVEDVRQVVEATSGVSPRELHVLPNAMHQLYENPEAAKLGMKQIVVTCKRYLERITLNVSDVIEPALREIAIQNRIERDRLKKAMPLVWGAEQQFWDRYLFQYQLIQKFPDFRELLDALVQALQLGGPVPLRLLDAGCGVGHFGAWLIKHLQTDHSASLGYVGLDFVESAVREAQRRHVSMSNRNGAPAEAAGTSNGFLSAAYLLADLNHQLPFADASFDRICCSLVLSYLQKPGYTLEELARVLRPGGRLVVSSLKPYADLSQIYRNFVSHAQCEDDVLEARKLLSCAGAIKQREGAGHYYFFSDQSLTDLLRKAGLEPEPFVRAFGNQANVIAATKR
jgi:ubiquinone/menaquinone biosynthesis C-methylase UbiE/pimeloyl-ACP methyl ester carboxylesterase/ribosome-associated toxin RatA of RatAB toxin-antitoxin module